MEKIQHKTIPVNGLNMHVAEIGEGPLILFLHGFPELWYSWRHQMAFMAEHGYRAVAPDMRGYGETTGAPLDDPSKFTVFHLVGDLISLLDAIAANEGKVFVVGHDWGAVVGSHLCMYRPDRVKAMVDLSVPLFPRAPQMNLVDKMRKYYGDDYSMCRFQEPGDIEAEFEDLGAKEVMKNFLALRDPGPLYLPKGKGFGYSAERAPWLTEEELDYYAAKFEQTGFTGAVNYYRALGLDWELNAPWAGAQVTVPVKYVVGEFDLVYHMPGTQDFIHKGGFKKFVPLLEEVVVIEGAAHFVNQERPDEINQHILAFLKQF
ncbi:alpha/beta-Hydrolases superfamily protein [Perilla frutescens var. hirtella]|nr:alpha/beta-Hydrolases superfamily protein [Perilla frutescens var. hirtella]